MNDTIVNIQIKIHNRIYLGFYYKWWIYNFKSTSQRSIYSIAIKADSEWYGPTSSTPHSSKKGVLIWYIALKDTEEHERKYRYISVIYHVSKGMDTIFCGEISLSQNFGRNRRSPKISYKSPIFRNISDGQREINELQCTLQKCLLFFSSLRGFESQTKGLGFNSSDH